MIERGTVYYCDLGNNGEGVQSGTRPVLVVSNDIGNKHSKVALIAPITSRRKTQLPTHFEISLEKKSTVLCEQVTIIHKSKLFDKIYTLTEEELIELDKALTISLGIGKRGLQ